MSAGAPDWDERRNADRFPVTWSVDCETEDTFLYAAITNISEMGIFVRTESPLPVGTLLVLRFSPAGAGEFVLDGRVQWLNPARPGCPNPGMGIRFLGLLPEDRERIVDVIRTIAYLPADVGYDQPG
jgi:type IV pilus assembly protein PilZ